MTREDLVVGRELNLPLGKRKGVKGGGPVQGTIMLQVGEPLAEEIEQEQGPAMHVTTDVTTDGTPTGFKVDKEVGYGGDQAVAVRPYSGRTMRDVLDGI